MKLWIGKVNADVLGNKIIWRYLPETLSDDKEDCEVETELLAGFAGWEVVELKEVKKRKKCKTKS